MAQGIECGGHNSTAHGVALNLGIAVVRHREGDLVSTKQMSRGSKTSTLVTFSCVM